MGSHCSTTWSSQHLSSRAALLPARLSRSAPGLSADPVDAVTGAATVTPPTLSRPWAQYEVKVCIQGAATCTTLSPLCTANADANANTVCPIPGRESGVTYDVTVVAIKAGGTRSPVSAPDDFTTPTHR